MFQTLSVGRLNFGEINNGIFPLLLFIFYGLIYVEGYIIGIFQTPHDLLVLYFQRMYPFFVIARVAECIAGTASVFMLYLPGKKMWNRLVGLIAAFLMAVSYVDAQPEV